MPERLFGLALAPAALLAFGAAIAGSGCAATPTPAPIRTFEQPQKMAAVCLGVNQPGGTAAPQVTPLPLGSCPPVPPNVVGTPFQNHFYVLVTQRTRGQLGVVDLTGGAVVDEDTTAPGTNLIPVGAQPSDVVVTPDVLLQQPNPEYPPFAFVASQNVDQPSIYAIPESRLLGNSVGVDAQAPTLTNLFACSLPGPPIALGVVMLAGSNGDGGAATDAGASGPAGSDAGASGPAGSGTGGPPYAIVALLLPLVPGAPAQLVTVDPTPFSSTYQPGGLEPCTVLGSTSFVGSVPTAATAPVSWPDGVTYADAGDLANIEPPLGPTCGAAPSDAGSSSGGMPSNADLSDDAAASDGGLVSNAGIASGTGALSGGGAAADGSVVVAVSLPPYPPSPNPTAMVVRDDAPVAYVADNGVPLIHVIDLSDPAAPVEIGQLLATSAENPSRQVPVGGLALSPPTSDLRRYLYAIDQYDGSIMIFDATSPMPATPPQTPMHRPHPELAPFAPVDRISFAAPVATMTFLLHDWPLVPPSPYTDTVHSYTGLLCNPNPNAEADASGVFLPNGGLGGYYRADEAQIIQPQGSGVQGFPHRLRGVFGFATLSNGTMVVIDVDDWDAPCRRPDPMEADGGLPDFQLGALDLPEPAPSSSSDLDPYHAPRTVLPGGQTGATQEAFFPVSAPNRIRSGFLLRNDPTSGIHLPYVSTLPTLFDVAANGPPISYSTSGTNSLILPTGLFPGYVDPSYIENPTDPGLNYNFISSALGIATDEQPDSGAPGVSVLFPGSQTVAGVRVSYDDPTAHVDQDWTVTYEGVLPTANGLFANLASTDGYETLTFAPAPNSLESTSTGAQFCERGIEDWNVGQQRAATALAAMTAANLTPTAAGQTLGQWTADYVEITDDLLSSSDGYWSESSAVNSCWQGLSLLDGSADGGTIPLDDDSNPNIASLRYNACFQTYNSSTNIANPGANANADLYYARDFPIVRATDDALVVGRFAWDPTTSENPTNRTIVGADPSNVPFLREAMCCFHGQAGFKVRAGGEWVTVGQIGSNPGVGLLNHVEAQPGTGACVVQCDDPSKVLLNARAFDIPPPLASCNPAMSNGSFPPAIDRNSVLAMRNPMMSFVMWGPCPPTNGYTNGAHTLTTRDLQWRFSLRGSFTPLTVSVQGTSAVPVSPQSMLYLAPYGQLAIIDGATDGEGLVLIDVNTLAFAHSPYF